MDFHPPPELCEILDLDSLNNYRIVSRLDRVACTIKVEDKDHQVNSFDGLTSQTYRLTKLIEKYGSVKLIEKLYENYKDEDIRLLMSNGVKGHNHIMIELLGDIIGRENTDDELAHLIINSGLIPITSVSQFFLPRKEPLIQTVKTNQYHLAELLLDSGYHPNVTNPLYETPLIWAVRQNKPEFIELFINRGADVNMSSDFPYALNPLSLAITSKSKNKMELIKYLLDHGADPTHKYGRTTPLNVAIKTRNREIIDLLKSK